MISKCKYIVKQKAHQMMGFLSMWRTWCGNTSSQSSWGLSH